MAPYGIMQYTITLTRPVTTVALSYGKYGDGCSTTYFTLTPTHTITGAGVASALQLFYVPPTKWVVCVGSV